MEIDIGKIDFNIRNNKFQRRNIEFECRKSAFNTRVNDFINVKKRDKMGSDSVLTDLAD